MTPQLVIVGRIATLAGDEGFGWAEAVAIDGGRVVAAGRAADVEPLAGTGTQVWRFGQRRVVMPALTDAHLHLATAAIAAQELDLDGAADRAAVEARIRAAHEALTRAGSPDGWLLGHGWSPQRMGGWPTAADLDRVAPGRPVALYSHDHHSRWASSAALAAAGIDADTPDPDGGVVRRGADGRPTGILHEHAGSLLARAIPRPSAKELEAAITAYAAGLAALGVVAVHDPGEMTTDPELQRGPVLYAALAAAGRLPLRVMGSVRPEQLPRALEVGLRSGRSPEPVDAQDAAAVCSAARHRVGWLKLFADGALGSRSAALLEPYEQEPGGTPPVGGPTGMLLGSPDELLETAGWAASGGIAVQIHGIGDAAVRTALDVLERLAAPSGVRAHRVEHAQLVHPDDVPRFRGTVSASVQPGHLIADAPGIDAAWGERGAHAFPLASLDAQGGLIPFGTDAPVEPPDPWRGVAMAVTRSDASWRQRAPFHPEQAIRLARALRAAALDPALVGGETDRGRLVPGHRADLLVLPADAFDEPPRPGGALSAARPELTLLDGEVVYRASGSDLA